MLSPLAATAAIRCTSAARPTLRGRCTCAGVEFGSQFFWPFAVGSEPRPCRCGSGKGVTREYLLAPHTWMSVQIVGVKWIPCLCLHLHPQQLARLPMLRGSYINVQNVRIWFWFFFPWYVFECAECLPSCPVPCMEDAEPVTCQPCGPSRVSQPCSPGCSTVSVLGLLLLLLLLHLCPCTAAPVRASGTWDSRFGSSATKSFLLSDALTLEGNSERSSKG